MTVYNNQYSWGSATPEIHVLSCNHVFAGENSAVEYEQQDQPGRYDAGKLRHVRRSWQTPFMEFLSTIRISQPIHYDAALAESAIQALRADGLGDDVGNAVRLLLIRFLTPRPTPPLRRPSAWELRRPAAPAGYNTASVYGIDVTITVGYTNFNATFVDQIYVDNGTYIQAGDSGSMSVVNSTGTNNNDPVGLDFAGSSNASFMNRMDHIAHDFGLTFVQSSF